MGPPSNNSPQPSSLSGNLKHFNEKTRHPVAMKERALNGKQDYQLQRPSTSMGPPNASSKISLSPAVNYNTNGFQKAPESLQMSSTIPQQKSYLKRPPTQSNPLSISTGLSSPSSGPSSSGSGVNRSSSLQSPQRFPPMPTPSTVVVVRKDIEMGQRRAICESIRNLRDEEQLATFIPQIQSQTETQCAIVMRRNRQELSKDMPTAIRNTVFSEKADETIEAQRIGNLLRDNMILRQRGTEPDDLTDISEDEDDESALTRARRKDLGPSKIALNKFKWAEQKMRMGGQVTKKSLVLQEKCAKMHILETELIALDKATSVRFEGDDLPRRRRFIDGSIRLFDGDKPEIKGGTEKYGCARARPMMAWTKRQLVKDIFEPEKFDHNKPSSSNMNLQNLPQHQHHLISVNSKQVVTHLTNGETREVPMFEYETYEDGKGSVGVKSIADMDVIDYVAPKEYQPLESRIMSYFFKVATTPNFAIRKNRDRSIFTSFGSEEKVRNGAERAISEKDRAKEIRERKRRLEMSSDEDEWKDDDESEKETTKKKNTGRRGSNKTSKKPLIRGRAVGLGTRSSSGSTRFSRNDISIDDYYLDDPFCLNMPEKIDYKQIIVPDWNTVRPTWLKPTTNHVEESRPALTTAEVQSSLAASNLASPTVVRDELWMSVAREHHKLMYLEKEKVKNEKKNKQNWQKKTAAGMPSPALPHSTTDDFSCMNEDVILQSLPPFDPHQFSNVQVNPAVRRFASCEPPFPKREFNSKSNNNPE